MSHHQQHRTLERGRRSTQEDKLSLRKESEQSAGCSLSVRRKLYEYICNKQHRTSAGQDIQQRELDRQEEDNPLRRTASEPILKLRSKRSMTGRQNPLQRKTSAPPAVGDPDSMAVSASSATVSSLDNQMNRQELIQTTTYSASSGKEDSPLQISIQHPVLWPAYAATAYNPQVFTLYPHIFTVTGQQWPPMPHRPLIKSQSAPSYIQQYTHIHTPAYTLVQPMYQQQWPQETFQQHTLPEKVSVGPAWPESPGDLGRFRKRTSEEVRISSQSPLESCNRQGVQLKENLEWRHKIFHQQVSRVHSFPDTFDTRLSSHSASALDMRKPNFTTGLVYEMMKHRCDCRDSSCGLHEADRVTSIWSRLQECGLRSQCKLLKGRSATVEELLSVHSEELVCFFTGPEPYRSQMDIGTMWKNPRNSEALKMAVGSVTELALCVARGDLRNGFAVVTPPGHHASRSQTLDSIVFNSVAIAAKQLQEQLKVKKILIVDWDVHHGSGTESIFYTDPSVLYISLHRYDDGAFFNGTGDPSRVGCDVGRGYNVNVAWSGGLRPPMGDAEYLAAFRTVVMPIAHEFSPNVVLVSAGFDAAEGHPAALGGYRVSPKCFGWLTQKLMELAEGRVVLVLEGGYELVSLCDASQACVSALLGNEPEPLSEVELLRSPCANAVCSLEKVLHVQSLHWRSVRSMLNTVSLSYVKAERRVSAGSEAALVLSGLNMTVPHRRQLPNEPVEDDETHSTVSFTRRTFSFQSRS
ncbi:histone deacetylase 4 isoform X2 [Danio rerio]|uniref:Histone deacetylase 4 isoform X2 n=6 Tax=Danio rerio TaxID=7955 RepID=A0A8M6Z7H0_DANRE|nr:histone deacetylase 4-like isoform X2 [Danio rerio]XP_021332879.1 histone deacetylase 4-like isoform X2 [Danio rerio]|eukprot:XP_017212141.1 histone deacetylase 4-like isoform X2 [Danio rerio]